MLRSSLWGPKAPRARWTTGLADIDPVGALLEVSWKSLGVWKASWELLEASWRPLEISWKALESPLGALLKIPHVNGCARIAIHHVDDIQHVNHHVNHAPTRSIYMA